MKNLSILILCLYLCSCSNEDIIKDERIIQEFSDSFYTINPYWNTSETTNNSRYGIVNDPLDIQNNSLVFHLFPEDFNYGGRRNEFVLKTKDTIGLNVDYSFKFLFTSEFFARYKELDWIMIHQWHDMPPRGMSWSDYNMDTNPPIQLYIRVLPGDKYYIVYAYGLKDKNRKSLRHLTYEFPLQPNEWYSFENTIKWAKDESGYSIPSINGEYLVKSDENPTGKLIGANMFNDVPNYFKMGLYGNYLSNDTISVYIDNFNYLLYLPEKTGSE
ncbi:MAG: hypothetical protein CL524_04540 [Aequorivita sp.]|mgnify:CR=1 FL=1|nr:hypothetical protein [Aequorivita sp.]MBF30059.1 hypothetical protein [Aequorivita sp.]|tara:strand:+ start:257497 stop:258312 length:816 start_codon:yes stop_codon:yes gene_type:complete